MKLNKSILLFLITILLFSLSSCSKDSNTTGPVATYTIQGKILDDSNNDLEGVTVTVSRNKFAKTDTTSVEGTYSIDGISNGEYTITPKKLGYIFSPENLKITIKDADLAVQNIVASFQGFTISGAIVDSTGSGVYDVNIEIYDKTNQIVHTDTTNTEGNYIISGIANGDYILKPFKFRYVFEPETWKITINDANLHISVITAVYKEYTISGTITGASGGVKVTLSGDASDSHEVNTDGGTYSFTVGHSGTYTVTPSKTGYAFTPYGKTFSNVTSNQTQDFTATESIPTMVTIPSGTFSMGDIQNYSKYSKEKPVHDVSLSSFEMSIYEVTQGQYQSVMGSNPSNYKSGDNYPVEKVLWYDAVKFCNALSDAADLDRCYDESSWSCDFSKNGFRLPTEAEWEYACRAGTETYFYTGNNLSIDGETSTDLDKAGWYYLNSGRKTHPVGQKVPNAWGLYDMHGNVWEWCNDWYDNYSSASVTDPTGPGSTSDSRRVDRGGGWGCAARGCCSAYRNMNNPTYKSSGVGFRVVRRPGGVTY